MKVVEPEIEFDFTPEPERHLGWLWMVKMREGDEEAEDGWLAENPRDAIAKAQARYPLAKLVSCHRRWEWTTRTVCRQFMDGRVL